VAVVWGTTLGLALAHWLAFRLTARLFSGSALASEDRMAIVGQALAAVIVAGLASVPLVFAGEAGPALTRLTLAALIGLFAFGAARRHGGGSWQAVTYAAVVVVIALLVAIGKYLLTGH
jgi:hypothetical protein